MPGCWAKLKLYFDLYNSINTVVNNFFEGVLIPQSARVVDLDHQDGLQSYFKGWAVFNNTIERGLLHYIGLRTTNMPAEIAVMVGYFCFSEKIVNFSRINTNLKLVLHVAYMYNRKMVPVPVPVLVLVLGTIELLSWASGPAGRLRNSMC